MQAVVQIRGDVNMMAAVEDTLDMLNLHGVNHCTLVPETDTYRGMLTKVNDYVAFGEPSQDALETVLATRLEPLEGDADVDEAWLAEHTEYDSFESLAAALLEEETTLRELGLSPTLRLHPPRGGHEGIKNPRSQGGQLGTHSTAEIDELLAAMR
ncbi:50S ribosomal protein L30 [Halodesulfurarchaeum formicicum]|uniref:Large ribosomal subunit protein uL30 n=1 Tax=Halodesulfurarchaeum formicicum TaxID=1873524 RepID=A0A1D8S2F9_9EURY|nr:50S ribosomal protein L30 [Halodesulfurarchaeum formicicum]AOW79552.1 50S ribosomal protein L30 [Halodesulfurarchaeum formicicum]APE94803.1 50S ribosomal protein L30 [Halodesulfurarchaeum formicicum]